MGKRSLPMEDTRRVDAIVWGCICGIELLVVCHGMINVFVINFTLRILLYCMSVFSRDLWWGYV